MACRFSALRLQRCTASLAALAILGVFCLLLTPLPSLAKEVREQLTLPVAGSAGLAKFTGNLSILRFVQVSGQVKAVGMISGTLVDAAGVPLGSALKGPVLLPVTVGAATTAALTQPQGTKSDIAGMSPGIGRPVLLLVTTTPVAQPPQSTCTALDIQIGSTSFNIAGLTVTTTPVGLTIGGETGGSNALGTLVCNILATVTNVANLVNLLNQLLGLLGGLL